MLIVAAMIWESLMGGGGGWEWRPPYLGRGECAVQSADGGLTARSVAQSARVRPLSTPRPPHRRPAVAISRAPQTGNLRKTSSRNNLTVLKLRKKGLKIGRFI